MAVTGNLVHQSSTTAGTGNITLVALNGKQSFNDAFGTGGTDVFFYFLSNRDEIEWEVGTGHLLDATTLVRDTVIESSNAGSLVNFSAGDKDVASDLITSSKINNLADNSLSMTLADAGADAVLGWDDSAGDYRNLSAADARTAINVDVAGTDNSTDVTLVGTPNYITITGQAITRGLIDLTTDVTGDLPVAEGGTGASDAGTARTNLGVDAAGTDNSTNVTLAGTPNYITIAGQVITRGLIDLTTDVTGDLPVAEGGTGASTAATARTNLGAQVQDAYLDDIAALTDPGADEVMGWDDTAGAVQWLTAAEVRAAADLGSLATLNTVNNGNWSGTDLAVANGGTGASDAGTARTNLGLGSLATLNTVNNGNWSGTDLAVANGGTGASDAGTARTNLGLGSLATLSSVSNTNWSGTDLAVLNGGTGSSTASGARTNLGVDAAGTDNSTNVTLAGSYDYITLSGQQITRNQIVLTTDVSGTLPESRGGGYTSFANLRDLANLFTDIIPTTFTGGGTFTANGADAHYMVYCIGGGGGGGGADGSDTTSWASGGGGEGGGFCAREYNEAEMGASGAVGIGSAGTAGSAAGGVGGDGGNTTFNPAGTGTTITASGGDGGTGAVASSWDVEEGGNNEGIYSGAQFGAHGQCGASGGAQLNPTEGAWGGPGGSAGGLGGGGGLGGLPITGGSSAGDSGGNFGGGGGGATSVETTSGAAGGAGSAGYCIVIAYRD